VDAREAVAELHGTAVAGIIGARADNSVGIVGVAPEAGLMALRACWQAPPDESAAVCSSFTLAKALQFAIDNNAKVINLSLGGPPYAAAEIAGLVALLIDLAPEQNPQQIREALNASERTPSSPRRGAIVDACAAVARTVGACACGCRIARGATPILVR